MDFIAEVKTKYPHLTTQDVATIVNKAKMFYYRAMYPCDPNADETNNPITTFSGQQWILAACDEFVERLGFTSAIAYRENGVAWTFDNAQLSKGLLNMIMPTIGVIS